jgi:hypothetical protein
MRDAAVVYALFRAFKTLSICLRSASLYNSSLPPARNSLGPFQKGLDVRLRNATRQYEFGDTVRHETRGCRR